MDFCGKSNGFADFENTVDRGSGSWISCESSLVRSRIVPVLMLGSWVLNEIWIIDLS